MHGDFSWRSPSARVVTVTVLDILAEVGYDRLTVEEVTARSGTAAWPRLHGPDLDALVSEALSRITLLPATDPTTGCLREDLLNLLRPWRNPRTRDELSIAAVLSAALHHPGLRQAVHEALDQQVAQTVGAILSPHMASAAAAAQMQTLGWLLRGLVLERLRTGARSIVDLERLVDFLLAGLNAAARDGVAETDRS